MFVFIPVRSISLLVWERTSRMKKLMMIGGLRVSSYWSANFIWDFILMTLVAKISLILFVVSNTKAFIGTNSGYTLLITLIFLLCCISWAYLFSFVFESYWNSWILLANMIWISGLICLVLSYVPWWIANFPKDAFLLHPYFCFVKAMEKMGTTTHSKEAESKSLFSQIYIYVISMIIETIIFLCIVVALDTGVFTKVGEKIHIARYKETINKLKLDGGESTFIEDGNARPENQTNNTIVEGKCLTKVFSSTNIAVKNISFGIEKGQCFGLCGANGAGKTTTFRMLLNEIYPTFGSAFINGKRISAGCMLEGSGYCPQVDCLDPFLTARQHLRLFSKLAGIDDASAKDHIQYYMENLGLTSYDAQITNTFSGGTKRRLSAAIAFIGDPSVIFLDEASTGLDPMSRFGLSNCIQYLLRNGKAVIFTSHAMEEVDDMCRSLVIMKKGEIICSGSPSELKNNYGSKYLLECIMPDGYLDMDALKIAIRSKIPDANLKEERHNGINFNLPLTTTPLYEVFEQMDILKESQSNILKSYSISQQTLDDVFIHLVRDNEM